MRTKQLKIGKEKKEAVLVAGGAGFKIYTAVGVDGWLIAKGRKVFVVEEDSQGYKTVGQYVNLRNQPVSIQEKIKEEFDDFVQLQVADPSIEPTA